MLNSNATVVVNAAPVPVAKQRRRVPPAIAAKAGRRTWRIHRSHFSPFNPPTHPTLVTTLILITTASPDGPRVRGVTVLDSVGALDVDGAGDFAYGAINFCRNTSPGSGAAASGIIVPVVSLRACRPIQQHRRGGGFGVGG